MKRGQINIHHFTGMATHSATLLVQGKRYSTIAAIGLDGIVDVHITSWSVNGVYCEFIENLLPQLLPFSGRIVVEMDNASIHHTERATALIEETGAIPILPPPYSPNIIIPIEECFSKVNQMTH